MTIKRLLKNKIFLTFLILGMIEPRCVGELAEYQGGIWSILHRCHVGLAYIGLFAIIVCIVLTVRKISAYSIAVILFQVCCVFADLRNSLPYMGDLIRAVQTIGLVLLLELFCRNGIQRTFLEVVSFWLGSYIVINVITILLFPGGMYVDDRGWTQNYFFGYKNSHIYIYLPYLACSALRDTLKYGRLKLRFFIFVGVITIASFVVQSSTSAIVTLFVAVLIVFAHNSTLPKWLNAATAMIASAVLSIAIIGFHFQTRFSNLIQVLFKKDATFSNRIAIWATSILDILRHPILGNGNDNVSIALYWKVSQCHNKYLDVLFVGGAVLMAIFIWLLYLVCYRLIKDNGKVTANIMTFLMFGYAILFLMESRRPDVLIFLVYALAFHVKYFNVTLAPKKSKQIFKIRKVKFVLRK